MYLQQIFVIFAQLNRHIVSFARKSLSLEVLYLGPTLLLVFALRFLLAFSVSDNYRGK